MKRSKAFKKVDGVPNLYHRSGRYYALVSIRGKQTWRSLGTDRIRAAKQKLAQLQTGRATEVQKRTESTMHEAVREVLAFRKTRRGVSLPLSPDRIRHHGVLPIEAESGSLALGHESGGSQQH